MGIRLDWRSSEDHRDLARRAAQALSQGQIVVFPTESTYVATALADRPAAVRRLVERTDHAAAGSVTLLLPRAGATGDYVVDAGPIGRRLAARCWPGPLALIFPQLDGPGWNQIPGDARALFTSPAGIGLWVPNHPAVLEVARELEWPLVAIEANGGEPAIDADAAARIFGHADWIVDDRQTRHAAPASIVRIKPGGPGFDVVREGVASAARLRRLASRVITFVCTGNTCRSPMAEAISKRMLAEELACDVQDLPERGFTILSAGVAAGSGGPASSGAVQVAREWGANLDDHLTQPMSEDLARLSDDIVALTGDHERAIIATWPWAAAKTRRLGRTQDVADPVGQPLEAYRACARQIASYLKVLLREVREAYY